MDWGGGAGLIVGRVGWGTVREVRERCGLGGGRQEQGHLLDRLVGGQQACRGQLLALAGGQQGDSRGTAGEQQGPLGQFLALAT